MTPRSCAPLRSCALAAVLVVLATASSALAQARVQVELKDKAGKSADGEVSLHDKAGEKVASCAAVQGHCEMSGVPGGLYEVRVKPAGGGPEPKPTTAMIPAEGTAKLIVNTGS